jgi:REP element-mobilizing transposase RayT
MARRARLVIPGLPYHVTQRGNRRETTFFGGRRAPAACFTPLTYGGWGSPR